MPKVIRIDIQRIASSFDVHAGQSAAIDFNTGLVHIGPVVGTLDGFPLLTFEDGCHWLHFDDAMDLVLFLDGISVVGSMFLAAVKKRGLKVNPDGTYLFRLAQNDAARILVANRWINFAFVDEAFQTPARN